MRSRTALRPTTAPLRAAAGALAAAALVVAVDPAHTHVPLCPFHAATGMQCPLCGSLRAVNALARGHATSALRDNAIVVIALPVLVLLWTQWVTRTQTGESPTVRPRWVNAAVVAVLVVFTVVRNLPAAAALRP